MTAKPKPEVYTGERCYVRELVNEADWPEVSVADCRVEPGVTTQLHALGVHEVYLVRSGEGRMRRGDAAPFDVGPGDVITIGKGTAQSIENRGAGDLVFACICAPRFLQDCYTSLE